MSQTVYLKISSNFFGKVGCAEFRRDDHREDTPDVIHTRTNFFLDTWRQLFPQGGSEYVNLNIESFVKFYCAQIAADNHAVREAACACIAELAQKCSPEALENQWEPMLNSLIDCFGDDSWPVRDATCIASGNFVNTLPEITKPMHKGTV